MRIDTPEPREAPMPQTGLPTHMEQSTRLLGVTADERLCCITSRVCVDELCMTVYLFDPNTGDCGEREFRPGFFMPPQAESGAVLFTLGEGSGRHGTFAFNIRTREVDEIVAGVHCDSWGDFVGYEQGRPIGRGSGAPALGPQEVGAPTQVVEPSVLLSQAEEI